MSEELNAVEVQCLLWLLMQGGSASIEDWRRFRDDSGFGLNTGLRVKGAIQFDEGLWTVAITEGGKKAIEEMT